MKGRAGSIRELPGGAPLHYDARDAACLAAGTQAGDLGGRRGGRVTSTQEELEGAASAALSEGRSPGPGGTRLGASGICADLVSVRDLLQALELAGVPLVMGDPVTARIVGCNRAFCELTGYSEAELLDRPFADLTHPDDRPRETATWVQALNGGHLEWRSEKRYVRKDGRVRWAVVRGAVIRDERGKPVRTIGVVKDITEHKQAEETRRWSEDRYRGLVEATEEVVWATTPEGLTQQHSPHWCSVTGQRPEEMLGRGWLAVVHPDDREQVLQSWARAVEAKARYETEYRIRAADGSYRRTQARAVPLLDAEGRVREWIGMNIDITDRRQIEERFRAAQELSLDAFVVLRAVRDAGGEIVDFVFDFANPAAGRLHCVPLEALVGRRLLDVMPDLRAEMFPLYARAVETGEPHDTEVELTAGGRRVWVRNMAVKVGDGVAVSCHDITARKQAEQALLEADRRKDEFLAMLAHELRNPLSAIQFSLSVSQMPSVPEPRRAWARSVMQRQLCQLGRMVDDLLDVSRITRGKITLQQAPLDLRDVVRQAVAAAAPLIDASKHELSLDVGARPLPVFGDTARLEQVIVNLLTNAAKYTPEGGRIWLSAGQEGAEIVVRVKDTGVGIPSEMLPRIFGLFEQAHPTLDRARGGLGLGLTLVKRLVEMHRGSVSAASEGEGRGSEFTVRLPAVEAAAEPGEAVEPASSARPRRVLVVDDNRDHAFALALLLEQAGHAIGLAHDGASALEMARSFAPDVVLLDIGLPEMDGYEVARRMRRSPGATELKIIAFTGYGQQDDLRRSREAGCDAHLVKPIAPDVLLAHIARGER
ncbi:PAS domain S-box protein [Sorangium sp. So ce124]|uniref:PAS domain S-box protein n=1 Tax=Sorangium sp. So ce124 TaxID=3133280 RepID=UPI003F5DEE81